MKKNIDNVVLTDEDLIAIDKGKHICLLREGEVYKINANLKEIVENTQNLPVQYTHEICAKCQDDENKKFIPLKIIKEVYNIINKGYQEELLGSL